MVGDGQWIAVPSISETQLGNHSDAYEAVTCPGCGRLHFVNKTTGKALSGRIKPKPSVRQSGPLATADGP
jgi:hypothetical protein